MKTRARSVNRIGRALVGLGLFAAMTKGWAETTPLKVFWTGNSLTAQVDPDGRFTQAVQANGRAMVVGSNTGAGVPISYFLKPQGFTRAPFGYAVDALPNGEWDVLTLQPFWSRLDEDVAASRALIDLARARSPRVRVLVYGQWPSAAYGTFAEQWGLPVSREELARKDLAYARKAQVRYGEYYRLLAAELRSAYPENDVDLVPVGRAMHFVDQALRERPIGALRSADDLYADTVHLNNAGCYIMACTWYAALFGESPARVPVAPYDAGTEYRAIHALTPELAAVIRRAAWLAVGCEGIWDDLAEKEPLAVATQTLDRGVAGCAYEMPLEVAFAAGPARWSVVEGVLPEGLALDPAGRLAGKPARAGESAVRLRVEDARGRRADAAFMLRVEEDSAPRLALKPPALRQTDFVSVALAVEGGNPPYRWTISKGKLPPGLVLQGDGRLVGTPALPGRWNVSLAVRDGDSEGAESAEQDVELVVTPAEPPPFIVHERPAPKIDGVLDASEKWVLDHELPGGVGRFGVRHSGAKGYLQIAVEVKDTTPVDLPRDPEAGDGIIVYVDGTCNRETIYNADDRRVFLSAGGKLVVRGDATLVAGKAARAEGVIRYEVQIRRAQIGATAPTCVVGLDIAVQDARPGAEPVRTYWHRGPINDTDPSGFAPVVLVPASGGGEAKTE